MSELRLIRWLLVVFVAILAAVQAGIVFGNHSAFSFGMLVFELLIWATLLVHAAVQELRHGA